MRARRFAPSRSAAPLKVRLRVGLLAAVLMVTGWSAPWQAPELARAADSAPAAGKVDPRLEAAQRRQQETQKALSDILAKIERLEAEIERLEGELAVLSQREQAQRAEAEEAASSVAQRVRDSYKRGTADPLLTLIASGSASEAAEQSRLLAALARKDELARQAAAAARTRTAATAQQVDQHRTNLADQHTELAAAKEEAARHVAEAERQVAAVRATLAAEAAAREAARREREARAAAASRAARSSRSGGGAPAAAAPVSGGIACPVGNPRSYTDTWGAARSGGRRHQGTDILAPHGTSIHAYESGTITRMNRNRLGGISLYLRGNSGTEYYYTHLSGYVGGLSPGSSVQAGQHIAFNGDSGNARGIPHLHFEVRPGGGGAVNPYPYVRRACG